MPEAVRAQVEPVLGPIVETVDIGGGCVSEALRVTTNQGIAFLKHDQAAPPAMFEAEAEGLRALKEAAPGLRVPEVVALGESWLAIEWLETAARTPQSDERLGRGLAEMHRASSGGWGWHRDGFIGPLPQDNESTSDWPGFWASRRLEPQLRAARDSGAGVGGDDQWARLFSALPVMLGAAKEDGDSLLHGDLWSGNALATGDGVPALVDPAVYYGHREVDLAMAELFGGFDSRFRASYEASWPLAPGYDATRRGVYQLYYLLVHVNLFGGGYAVRTRQVLDRLLRGL